MVGGKLNGLPPVKSLEGDGRSTGPPPKHGFFSLANGNFDLFGEPAIPPRGNGRPPLVWSSVISRKISLLFACGHSEADVAAAIGHCTKTLRRVFSKEWRDRKIARLKLKGEQLHRLNSAAAEGNVTAEKALAAMVQAERMQATSGRIAARADKAPKGPAPGKKEAAKAAADQVAVAGGKFAPPAPPPSLLN